MKGSAMTSRKLLLGCLVALIVGGISVGAIAQSGEEPGPVPGPEPAVQSASQAGDLGIFKQPRSAADELPARVRGAVETSRTLGANPDLSVRLGEAAGRVLYALPARDSVCLVLTHPDGPSMSCQETDAIVSGTNGPALSLIYDEATFYAAVPDGVESVTLHLASGKTVNVPVQNGGYIVQVNVNEKPQTVSYDGPNGTVTQPASAPSFAAAG